MEAQSIEGSAVPEIECSADFGVEVCGGDVLGVVDVHKEEGASPVVAFEHLKGGGEVSAVEVVHLLNVGLGLGTSKCQQHGCN